MKTFREAGIDTGGRTSGKMKTFCPNCRDQRKNKRDKSLSIDLDKGIAYCHYCGESFQANNGYAEKRNEWNEPSTHIGTLPTQPTVNCQLSTVNWKEFPASFQQFFTGRNIGEETLKSAGISFQEEYMSQTGRKEWCICFNYYEQGRLVNAKFRDRNKNFKMIAGAEVIPYNIDGIHKQPECIITEGEMDALSFMEIGRTDVISVPAGANKNLTWMDRFVETHFEDKRVVYIAVDTDRKGQELCGELVRRLGAARCRVVGYPEGCKDANEVLVQHGSKALIRALEEAPETPLNGVFNVKDVSRELRILFERGMERGAETGWENFDRSCTFELGRLCVVTGIPGAGKSEFVDELMVRLNLRHDWKAAVFSPENMPLTYHLQKLMEKVTGQHFKEGCMEERAYSMGELYLSENFNFILPKENFTVENILSIAKELVRRQGVRIFTIDPFNRFEHQIPPGQTETQYISRVLDDFTNFAVRNHCLVILVAHPRKMNKEPGSRKEPVPTLYDINGSAAFFNKCDFGMTVERDYEVEVTRVHIQKVKFRHLGQKGEAEFIYNTINGRLIPCEIDEQTGKPWKAQYDNEMWSGTLLNT